MGGGPKSFQEIEQQGGLAHAGLRHQGLKAELTADSVDQGGERFPVSLAVEKKTRVGCTPKGVLPQPKMDEKLTLYRVFGGVALHRAPIRVLYSKSTAIARKALLSRISEDTGSKCKTGNGKVKAVAA